MSEGRILCDSSVRQGELSQDEKDRSVSSRLVVSSPFLFFFPILPSFSSSPSSLFFPLLLLLPPSLLLSPFFSPSFFLFSPLSPPFFLFLPPFFLIPPIWAQGHLGSDGTLQQCETVGSEGLFVWLCPFAAVFFLSFSFSRPFVGSLNPGEGRGRGTSLVEITSSDPISVSTPVLPRTVPVGDTVTDSEYVASALNSIDTLFAHPGKRDGGAQGSSPRSEHTMVLDVPLLH